MKKNCDIRHRRLYAFYRSKVLNALMIVLANCLMLIGCYNALLLPVVCGCVTLALFIGYSVWLWVSKPGRVVINNLLSDMSGYLVLYFLITGVVRAGSQWWCIASIVVSIVIMFVTLVCNTDETFDIAE